MNRTVIVASLIAFIASFCTLVIELVAGRIMAPYVGVSLYTWTSIIGVVLAGISLGAYLGGLLADRFPRYITLGALFVLSGLLTFTIQPVAAHVGGNNVMLPGGGASTAEFIARILLLTTYVFLLPAVVLGMISPVVVKLAVNNLKTTGNTVGKIYAYSTLGSIIGTFATGFWLIEALSTTQILTTVGWVLLFSAAVSGILLRGFRTEAGALSTLRIVAAVLFTVGVLFLLQTYLRWDSYYRTATGSLASMRMVFFERDKVREELLQQRLGPNLRPDEVQEVRQEVETSLNRAFRRHLFFLVTVVVGGLAFLLFPVLWWLSLPDSLKPKEVKLEAPFEFAQTEPLEELDLPADQTAAKRAIFLAGIATFVASFCILAIELVAGRILAPHVGVSLYTWTSIIGVVLAGISLGAYLGGKLADRLPHCGTLGWLFLVAGLICLGLPVLVDYMGAGEFVRWATDYYGLTEHYGFSVPFIVRILLVTTAVFFLPSLVLGMISPVVVRLCVDDLKRTGGTVGKIYAFSTLGSILGTFLTGFFLIEFLGTRTLLYSVAALLIVLAPIFGGLFREIPASRRLLVGVCSVLLAATLVGFGFQRELLAKPLKLEQEIQKYEGRLVLFKESDYYTLKITDGPVKDHDTGGYIDLRTLVLDHLVHSYTHMQDPSHLHYDYLRIYEELVAWQRSRRPANRYLFIGGGGYTLPRYFDKENPQAEIDVVEIDPWVTKAARDYLGIKDTRIRSINQDGRWFAINCKEKYDFIFGDAFNDLSIPYHLTTLEFDQQLKNLLSPEGLLMALVIDSIKDGEFLPSYLKTLQAVFGEDRVYLITLENSDLDEIGHETCIIVCSQTKLDFDDFTRFVKERAEKFERAKGKKLRVVSNVVPQKRLQEYLRDIKRRGREPMVLTDDYVPADNLIAKVFHERYSFKKRSSEY